jgi:hypothetical protein
MVDLCFSNTFTPAQLLKEFIMTIGLLLTVIFLVLKLTGNINWNWALIFLPVIVEFVVSFSYARSPFWWRGRP